MAKEKLLSKAKREKLKRDTSLKREFKEYIEKGSMIEPTLEVLAEKYKLKPSSVRYIIKDYNEKYHRNNSNKKV